MKMTKELKEVLLKGFGELLDKLRVCESLAQKFEVEGKEKDRDFWRENRERQQKAILKSIEDLIEVEGE